MPALTIVIAELGKLISGLQKHQPAGTLVIDGKSYTTADVVTLLQALIDALQATVSARATYKENVAKSDALVISDRPFVRDLKQSIQIQYGNTASVLSDFGLTPRKTPAPRTAAEKAAAADKARATRKARNTMGKKQKKGITGASVSAAAASTSATSPTGTVTTVGPIVTGATSSNGSSVTEELKP